MGLFKDDFDRESEQWNKDVRARAAELVRRGTPPYDALDLARRQIQNERRGSVVPKKDDPLAGLLLR